MREDAPDLPIAQRRSPALSGDLTAFPSARQQADHAFGPALASGFMRKRQFAQQVRIAQGVLAVQLPIRFPAVMHQHRYALGQDAVRSDGGHTALGMHSIPGERVTGHRMQPMQTGSEPQARFVGVRYRHINQSLRNACNVRQQQHTGLVNPRAHRRRRNRQPLQLGDELCATPERQQLPLGQMHRECAHVRCRIAQLQSRLREIGVAATAHRCSSNCCV